MTKSNVEKQFGKNANAYVQSEIHRLGKDLQKLIEMTELTGKEKLLDVATGGGHTANAFASHVKEVVAFDLTEEMLAEAEKFIQTNGHTNVQFVLGDAEKLPFPENSFSIVTCRIAPHHFPNLENFVREVARVLTPNGQFLLDDNVAPEVDKLDIFYNTVEKKRDYSHHRAWKKTEWVKLLEKHQLFVQEMHRFVKTFRFDPWCDRMQLSQEDKQALTQFIVNASDKVKKHFHVVEQDGSILSFQGEAVLIKAVKKS